MSSEKLDAAIKSIEAGDKTAAMRLLAGIVVTDPKNEMAWLWLSKCVEEQDRKRYCLTRILDINPNNQDARQALAQLESLSKPSRQEPIERTSDEISNQLPQAGQRGGGCQTGSGCLIICILLIVGAAIIWSVVQPGVFTIQPIGALPDGVTFIYSSRNPEMPFFSSPDGLCLKTQGAVTLLCRAAAISASSELTKRVIIKLPYSRWAYLQSTGGLEFEK